MKELLLRHPKTTVIWAHVGLGRVVHPVKDQLAIIKRALSSPVLSHFSIDISWDYFGEGKASYDILFVDVQF